MANITNVDKLDIIQENVETIEINSNSHITNNTNPHNVSLEQARSVNNVANGNIIVNSPAETNLVVHGGGILDGRLVLTCNQDLSVYNRISCVDNAYVVETCDCNGSAVPISFKIGGCFALFFFHSLLGYLSVILHNCCLLYTSPSPRDQRGSRMPSSA